ncbi:MAG TPA: GNAT family N-acetyltransferase [Vicinamibacterales bacterium]|nr:GNAT family N-acetyltransferase [Vicinamibacterales bacterium]
MSFRQVQYKVATESSEFEQIFQLAYDTFVEEIPQHQPNPDRRHVDRFHDENTYLIAMDGDEVVGMLTIRGERPFSLDEKLGNVDPYLPAGRSVCELRLLAVRRDYRRGTVFRGLIDLLVTHGRARGFDLAIISGTLRQEKLYGHLGFVPFARRIGTAEAPFQPMYLTFEAFQAKAPTIAAAAGEPISFLPGPVPLARDVRAAFERLPVSHRNGQFKEEFARTKSGLCRLANAPDVQILLGTGTLANDVVAAQLTLLGGPGVVLSNGEFGERLIDHARRMRLEHEAVEFEWGRLFDAREIERAVERVQAKWLWAVASETSTGMLNDLHMLKSIALRHGLALCLDCVSAIGAVPIDLSGVYLASGASGKALAALPGLSFVYHAYDVVPEPTRLPRYLDLGYYADKEGIPFTHSSNLVAALAAALGRFNTNEPFEQVAALSRWLRPRLRELGLPILVDDEHATPAVVTIPLPPSRSAIALGDRLQRHGLLVAYQSEYLERRNWFQIGLMGHCSQAHLERLVGALARILTSGRAMSQALQLRT